MRVVAVARSVAPAPIGFFRDGVCTDRQFNNLYVRAALDGHFGIRMAVLFDLEHIRVARRAAGLGNRQLAGLDVEQELLALRESTGLSFTILMDKRD